MWNIVQRKFIKLKIQDNILLFLEWSIDLEWNVYHIFIQISRNAKQTLFTAGRNMFNISWLRVKKTKTDGWLMPPSANHRLPSSPTSNSRSKDEQKRAKPDAKEPFVILRIQQKQEKKKRHSKSGRPCKRIPCWKTIPPISHTTI